MILKRKFLYFISGVMMLLFACSVLGGGYEMTFDSTDDWILESSAGFSGFVQDGAFRFVVDEAQSIFWTFAGEELEAGTYEVQVTQILGPDDPGYGIIFGVDETGNDFYLFEVSSDGFFLVAKCTSGCDDLTVLNEGEMWTETSDVRSGLNVTHNLKVEVTATGDMTFSDNGVVLLEASDPDFVGGDIGMIVETFDGANVTVEFDNLKFTPPEE